MTAKKKEEIAVEETAVNEEPVAVTENVDVNEPVELHAEEPKAKPKRLTLHQKILGVMNEISVVKKDGKVEFKNTKYNYQKEEDVTAAVREGLLKYGLTIIPVHFDIKEVKDGLTSVMIQYKITDSETGECEFIMMGGQGQDSGDKGIYKAETGAFKYLQKQMLWLGSQESDPDDIPSEALKQQTRTTNKITVKNSSNNNDAVVNVDNYLDTVFTYGKHKGKTIKQVAEADKQYIVWCAGKQGAMQAVCQKAVEELKLS